MSYSERAKTWVELFDVRKGSTVRVLRSADYGEAGWKNSWESNMDDFIGKDCTILSSESSMYDQSGITLYCPEVDTFTYSFPFFVLGFVSDPKELYIEGATPDYDARICDGFVEINGSKIPFEKMAELRAALKQYKES